jgi:5,10-methylenetetrahydromethanopterin reductase
VAELESATADVKALLLGEQLDVGAARPAYLRLSMAEHGRDVPVWVACSGPRTLRAAGRVADGVFLRVGVHPANLRAAVDAVRAGAADVGRPPDEVRIGLVVHTCWSGDRAQMAATGRAMAAGFYEYAPALFEQAGFDWPGEPPEDLKRRHDLWPDFHHAADLVAAGGIVDFLPDEVATSFAFVGSPADVADQVDAICREVPEVEIIVPHPVPMPLGRSLGDHHQRYLDWLAAGVLARL